MLKTIYLALFISYLFSGYLKAQEVQTNIDSILVVTQQQSNLNMANSEFLYSLDIELTHQRKKWGIFAWLEHAKNTNYNEISNYFGDVNSDAGTVSHNNAQISAFYIYSGTDIEHPSWQFGLTEVSTLIDTSNFANDEVSQFLSAGLVNNKSINFPDYALSSRIQNLAAWQQFGYRIVLASSHGLGENNGNYHQLLTLKNKHEGEKKGFFKAAELVYTNTQNNIQANFGLWKNTGIIEDDGNLIGTSKGYYAGVDYSINEIDLNLRYGHSDINETDEQTSINFIGGSFQMPFYEGVLGSGISFTRSSSEQNDLGKNTEVYYRFKLQETCYLTAALQWTNEVNIPEDNRFNQKTYFIPTLRLEVML